jgi:phage tail-like protein
MSIRSFDPFLTYQFALEISNGPIKAQNVFFSEASGLSVDYNAVEFKTMDQKGRPISQRIPGRPTLSPITLKRGITTDMNLWAWFHLVREGKLDDVRADVDIRLFDRSYKEVYVWSLSRAWPSKISGPQFSAGGNDVAMQELTLVYEDITYRPTPT